LFGFNLYCYTTFSFLNALPLNKEILNIKLKEYYPMVEKMTLQIVLDTKNIGKIETDRRYFLSMQVSCNHDNEIEH